MLASITPLGERGRGSTWAVTVTAFALGRHGGGRAARRAARRRSARWLPGGLRGARCAWPCSRPRSPLAARARRCAPRAVPGPRRQVNERWLDEFRGWVYGLGFGAQLGLGVTTVVTSAATYVGAVAAVPERLGRRGRADRRAASARVRGLTPLAAARVRRPEQLLALHARLDRWRAPRALGARWRAGAASRRRVAGASA